MEFLPFENNNRNIPKLGSSMAMDFINVVDLDLSNLEKVIFIKLYYTYFKKNSDYTTLSQNICFFFNSRSIFLYILYFTKITEIINIALSKINLKAI